MATADKSLGNFVSTMLISKMHKKENYKLATNLKYTLMHPNLSRIPFGFVSFFMTILNVLIGIVFVIVTVSVGLGNPITILLAFVIGYILMNIAIKRYYNKSEASVSELNIFVIASKTIDPKSNNNYKTPETRMKFENKIKFLHDSYKNEVFNLINTEVKRDYELKYSLKVLRTIGSELNVDFDKKAEVDLYEWVSSTLEKMYKGTRISYWDNKDGNYRLVVTNLEQERDYVITKYDISDVIDELNLLIFSNHYKEAIEPLFNEILDLVKPVMNESYYKEFVSLDKQYNENFSECMRVLLSKSLGMQEVLKTTRRQFERLNEAKSDLEEESKDIESPELEKLVHQFSENGSMKELLGNLDQLVQSLTIISKNLRSLDFDKIPDPTVDSFQPISKLYFALEKLRFVSTWFEDIASYTNIAGGTVSDIDSSGKDAIPSDVVLRTKDVYKTFSTAGGRVYAVRGVNFDIKEGEFVGLFGPSGSGKTTLLNIMAGLDMPDAGNVYVDGVSIQSLSENKLTTLRRDKMGFIFQFYNLIPILKNRENVSYPAEIGGKNNSKQASSLLQSVQLGSYEKQYPNKLSGGQMQRVTIARSLINKPKILFADEPTGDLDSVTGKEVMDLLSKFNKEENTTVVFVTHDKSLLSYCSRVINMVDGKIVNN